MNIEIFTLTYNEEIMLPQFIKYYRSRFPNCKITVYDNESTDSTVDIAIKNNCEVISWNSGNTIRDDLYLEIKNNCWKQSLADWVFVVDCDELVDITEEFLESTPCNIIKTQGWEMIGDESLDIDTINFGTRSPGYDKCCVFKPSVFKEINYSPGAHNSNPKSNGSETIIFNSNDIKLWHYKWLTLDYVIKRYQLFNSRLSDINKTNGWGVHYLFSTNHLIEFYNIQKQNRIKVR